MVDTKADHVERVSISTGPSESLLSRTGTTAGKPGAISTQLPPLLSL